MVENCWPLLGYFYDERMPFFMFSLCKTLFIMKEARPCGLRSPAVSKRVTHVVIQIMINHINVFIFFHVYKIVTCFRWLIRWACILPWQLATPTDTSSFCAYSLVMSASPFDSSCIFPRELAPSTEPSYFCAYSLVTFVWPSISSCILL